MPVFCTYPTVLLIRLSRPRLPQNLFLRNIRSVQGRRAHGIAYGDFGSREGRGYLRRYHHHHYIYLILPVSRCINVHNCITV